MLITDRFPLDKNSLIKQDQTFSCSGMTWDDYELLSLESDRGYRISFCDGVITAMSPSQNHERIKDFIFLLIVTYCDAIELDYYPTGSTTFKDQNQQVGKEPDCSFCFNSLKDVPDLAIEVVFSSGGTNDLEKYQRLGVKEVWFWMNNKLEIYFLTDGIYQCQDYSFNLSKLEAKLLTKYIAQSLNNNPRKLKSSFIGEIQF